MYVRKPFIIALIGALLVMVAISIGLLIYTKNQTSTPKGYLSPQPYPSEPQQVSCTLEALLCPDGSTVGRVGPKCEFAPCPGNSEEEAPTTPIQDGQTEPGTGAGQ